MSFLTINNDSFYKILELPNVVSNVVEMQFATFQGISPEVILRFLKRSQHLKKLSTHNFIYFDQPRGYSFLLQALSSNLNDEWKCSIVDPYKNAFQSKLFMDRYECYVIERINS